MYLHIIYIEMKLSSRYVNLKVIDNDDFIFFSNYTSPKARDFHYHEQIAATIYWAID